MAILTGFSDHLGARAVLDAFQYGDYFVFLHPFPRFWKSCRVSDTVGQASSPRRGLLGLRLSTFARGWKVVIVLTLNLQ